jgi:hypothetical protein
MKITLVGEIEYLKVDGTKIHSDIDPGDKVEKLKDPSYRKFLHDCLEEWMNESRGTGGFYIKQEGYEF